MINTSHWYDMITGTGNGLSVMSSLFWEFDNLTNLSELEDKVKDNFFFCFKYSQIQAR